MLFLYISLPFAVWQGISSSTYFGLLAYFDSIQDAIGYFLSTSLQRLFQRMTSCDLIALPSSWPGLAPESGTENLGKRRLPWLFPTLITTKRQQWRLGRSGNGGPCQFYPSTQTVHMLLEFPAWPPPCCCPGFGLKRRFWLLLPPRLLLMAALVVFAMEEAKSVVATFSLHQVRLVRWPGVLPFRLCFSFWRDVPASNIQHHEPATQGRNLLIS